jgi:hypothetical protein
VLPDEPLDMLSLMYCSASFRLDVPAVKAATSRSESASLSRSPTLQWRGLGGSGEVLEGSRWLSMRWIHSSASSVPFCHSPKHLSASWEAPRILSLLAFWSASHFSRVLVDRRGHAQRHPDL